MKNILIFSGTTEGRKLSKLLAKKGISHSVSVATEYGERIMEQDENVTVLRGRLNEDEMCCLFRKQKIGIVIDATHPYATKVTQTIRYCVENLQKEKQDIVYLRLEREVTEEDNLICFTGHEECKKALQKTEGNVLLTTGSKDLSVYCDSEELRQRLYVRVLPAEESLSICREQGLLPNQILALQGPFSTEMNLAFLRQYQIRCMVTKESGRAGGFEEKKEACLLAGIPLYVIKKEVIPEDEKKPSVSYSFSEILTGLEELAGVCIRKEATANLQIVLAGVGMGSKDSMTAEVKEAIEHADLLIGADRLIKPYRARLAKKAAYMPEEIVNWLQEKSREYAVYEKLLVVILFSGDTGFYSGCPLVRERLLSAITEEKIKGSVKTLPGISSFQAMAAACNMNWQDIDFYSIHGRKAHPDWKRELYRRIKASEKIFLLVDNAKDIRSIGEMLLSKEEEQFLVYVGYQLSYPEEEICCLTPGDCIEVTKEGLYAVIIVHAKGEEAYRVTPGIPDTSFLRGKVPMTKEEIREISICKLQLCKNAIVYDIGCGTGSIAVEIAKMDSSFTVYGIEQKKEALSLIRQNKEKFCVNNLCVVEGRAPEAVQELETPTHAFIGGSSGQLMALLQVLYDKNPAMRVVINAVSMETLSLLNQIPREFPVREFQMVQVQVNRYTAFGSYHLPKAENPVVICSFAFAQKGEEADEE